MGSIFIVHTRQALKFFFHTLSISLKSRVSFETSFYSNPTDMSVLKQHACAGMPQDVSVLGQSVLPLDVPVLQQTMLHHCRFYSTA